MEALKLKPIHTIICQEHGVQMRDTDGRCHVCNDRQTKRLKAQWEVYLAAEQGDCPKCGVNRQALQQLLKADKGSENYTLAMHLIEFCPECKKAVSHAIS